MVAERPKTEDEAEDEAEAPAPAVEAPVVEPAGKVSETASAPKKSGSSDSYLDDIEAMESELTSGWEGDEPEGEGEKS